MPLEIGYHGDGIIPASGMVQTILNPRVSVIPPVSIIRIDTGQTIYMPHKSVCVFHPDSKILSSRGLIVIGNVYSGSRSGFLEENAETEHRIIVSGFNPHEFDINLVPGDVLGYLTFGRMIAMKLTKREVMIP